MEFNNCLVAKKTIGFRTILLLYTCRKDMSEHLYSINGFDEGPFIFVKCVLFCLIYQSPRPTAE